MGMRFHFNYNLFGVEDIFRPYGAANDCLLDYSDDTGTAKTDLNNTFGVS